MAPSCTLCCLSLGLFLGSVGAERLAILEGGLSNVPPTPPSDARKTTLSRRPRSRPSAVLEVSEAENVSAAAVGASSETDLDCGSIFPSVFASAQPSTRELLWDLRHRGTLPTGKAAALLALHDAGDDAGNSETLRLLTGRWLSDQQCRDQDVCAGVAARLLGDAPSQCEFHHLLGVAHAQLEDSWRSKLARDSALSARVGSSALTAPQLAVLSWGSQLLGGDAAAQSAAAPFQKSSQGLDAAQRAVAPFLKSSQGLDALVAGMAPTNGAGDLVAPTKSFLHSAEEWLRSTNSTDRLVPLLRLLHTNRGTASASSLSRDAAVVTFCEPRVKALEAVDLSKLDVSNSSTVAALQAGMEDLLSHLRGMESDHEATLPGDKGVLSAFWLGRVRRVQRRLEDRLAGREPGARKTVLVWTCSFGKGHRAVTKALEQYLNDYDVIVVDTSKDPVFYEDDAVGDFLRAHITPDYDSTWFFNEVILKRKQYWLENGFERFQSAVGWARGDNLRFPKYCPAPSCDLDRKRLLRRTLLRVAPDMMISDYHMELLPILELAEEHNGIPLLHLATDIEAKMSEVLNHPVDFPHFRLGLPFAVQESFDTITPISLDQTFVSGYGVRPPFLTALPSPEDRSRMRLHRGIPSDAQVVLVMSGGGGQAVPWPSQLADSASWHGRKLHVVVVAGGNTDYGLDLESRYGAQGEVGNATAGALVHLTGSNKDVTLQVAREPSAGTNATRPFYISAGELVALMDVSDVLVTKAGGSTTAEAAYRGIPVLFDAVDGMLKWEDVTAKVFESHDRGLRFTQNSQLEERTSQAVDLGRSRALAFEGGSHAFVNTTERVRRAVQEMYDERSRSTFILPVEPDK